MRQRTFISALWLAAAWLLGTFSGVVQKQVTLSRGELIQRHLVSSVFQNEYRHESILFMLVKIAEIALPIFVIALIGSFTVALSNLTCRLPPPGMGDGSGHWAQVSVIPFRLNPTHAKETSYDQVLLPSLAESPEDRFVS